MTPNVERLTFAWWNTALSPPVPNFKKRTDQDYEEAARIVGFLLRDFHVDFLALGEVTDHDLCILRNAVGGRHYGIYDGTGRDGRSIHDIGAIYNTGSLHELNSERITDYHGRDKLKVAHRVDLQISGEKFPLHLFISHWPSRLRSKNDSKRITLGFHLREKVRDLVSLYRQNAPVILMGDFNEEPFHQSIELQLLATRDRSLAKRATHLYNPFWRYLGESEPYSLSRTKSTFAGTCFMKRGSVTKWKTVDQIILSSAFVGGSQWHLNEELPMVLDLWAEAKRGYAARGIFDHLPVIAVIEKARQNGGKHD